MNTALAPIDLSAARAASLIRLGRAAWVALTKTASEQRSWWMEVGIALVEGKDKANRKPGQKFSDWCLEMFPGLDTTREVADAIWFTEFRDDPENPMPPGLTHPTTIRKWANEQKTTEAIPPELQSVPPPVSSTVLPKDTAKTVNKLHHRSTSGDEGSAQAERMLNAYARKHGVSVEDLTEAAAVADPEGCYRFSPTVQQTIDLWRDNVLRNVDILGRHGISKDAARALLINIANSL